MSQNLPVYRQTKYLSRIERLQKIARGEAKGGPRAKEVIEQISKAWELLEDRSTNSDVIGELCGTFGIKKSRAYRIIEEAKAVFGQLHPINKKNERLLMARRLEGLAKKLEEKEDFEGAAKVWANVAKIQGLLTPDVNALIDPKAFLVPGTVIFSDDPADMKRDTEDVEHIDITPKERGEQ
jgi:hypothetical protein